MRCASVFVSIVALLMLTVDAGTAQATVLKADNTDDLNVGSSWALGTVPGTADVVEWDSTVTGANTTSLGVTTAATVWGGIKISNPGGAVTINCPASYPAGDINLGASGIDMSTATQNLTVNNSGVNIRLQADQTWTVASGRTLTVTAAASNKNWTITGEGNTTISGGIDGWGKVIKNGSGTLTTAHFGSGGSNGTLDVNAGTVNLTGTGGIGGQFAVSVANGATLNNGSGQGISVSSPPITLTGGTLSGNGDATWGSWTLYKDVIVSGGVNTSTISSQNVCLRGTGGVGMAFNVGSGATNGIDLDVTGTIFNLNYAGITNSLTKKGTGVMRLSGVSTYAGGTTIDAGTLLVNNTSGSGTGTGAVTVNSLGTLAGSGTISGLVTGSGTLAPGNIAGKLTLSGGLTMDGGTYDWQLDSLVDNPALAGSNWDLIDLASTGALDVTGPTIHIAGLTPDSNAFWQSAHDWTIISNALSMDFAGTESITGYDAALGTFNLGTSGNNVVLLWTPVPEPGTLVLLATAMIGLLAYAWRRRK